MIHMHCTLQTETEIFITHGVSMMRTVIHVVCCKSVAVRDVGVWGVILRSYK